MIANTYESTGTSVKHIIVTIDPSGCKNRNCYVLTSMIFITTHSNGIRCVVCLFISFHFMLYNNVPPSIVYNMLSYQ